MRSSRIASSTLVKPASRPMPTCTVASARTTGTPRPPAPTSAAITTMDRLSMMHWVMQASMRDDAQAKEHERRNEIDESRQRLHEIQHRTQRGGERRAVRGRNPQRYAEAA